MSPSPLLAGLKERKLVQWALAYLAGAYLVFESVEVLAEPWSVSPATQRALHILLAGGFFVALVLAWYHGEKGRQKVSGPELLMVAALLVIAGVAVSSLDRGDAGPAPDAGTAVPSARPVLSDDPRPRIAVLPCERVSADPADEHLAVGLHDAILLKLQKIASLSSIGRASVLRYAADPQPTAVVADDLGVGFVGECTVSRAGDRIRLIFQLLEAETGTQLWAEDHDTTFTAANLFDIQAELAQRVARSVGAVLTPQERARIQTRPTDLIEAYDLYMLGRTRVLSRQGPALYEALDLFRAAIQRDSSYALAYAGIAEAYMLLPQFGHLPEDEHALYANAKAAARRAVELNPELSEAHAALAYIAFTFDWDWERAEQEFVRAIELGPGNSQARSWYAELLLSLVRYDQALEQAVRGFELDPRAPNTNVMVAFALWHVGRLEEAEAQFRRTIEIAPDYYPGYALISLLKQQGRRTEAMALMPRLVRVYFPASGELTPTMERVAAVVDSADLALLVHAVGDSLFRDTVVAIMRRVEDAVDRKGSLWTLYVSIDAVGEATGALIQRIDARGFDVPNMNWRHYSHVLRRDPRYPVLLERVGLPMPP